MSDFPPDAPCTPMNVVYCNSANSKGTGAPDVTVTRTLLLTENYDF